MPDYKYVHNKPESELIPSQVECLRFCEHLGFCVATKYWIVKSSTLFECKPTLPMSNSCPPDLIHDHVISVSRPSSFFAILLLP